MYASAMRKMAESSKDSPVDDEFNRVMELMKKEAKGGYYETRASINSRAYREIHARLVRMGYIIDVISAGTASMPFQVRISW